MNSQTGVDMFKPNQRKSQAAVWEAARNEWIQENSFFSKSIWDVLAEKAKMVAEALMVLFHLW